tara:strand:- start:124 stop:504 length:381 start_codon:yes stop_codon:yes gene_type:complete
MNLNDLTKNVESLLSNSVISQKEHDRLIKKIGRMGDQLTRQATRVRIQNEVLTLISEQFSETQYFSVKKTSNSEGILEHLELARNEVAQALSGLVEDGVLRKVGLVNGVEKDPSEVNAFQIRYTRA